MIFTMKMTNEHQQLELSIQSSGPRRFCRRPSPINPQLSTLWFSRMRQLVSSAPDPASFHASRITHHASLFPHQSKFKNQNSKTL
jgi:hypothetical protein